MEERKRLKKVPHLLSPKDYYTHLRSPSDSSKDSFKDSIKKTVLGRSKSSAATHKRLLERETASALETGSSVSPVTPSSPLSGADCLTIMVDRDHPTGLKIPLLLQRGTPLYKISSKKAKIVMFYLDVDAGLIRWESKKGGKILLENIKELRPGGEASSYRLQLKQSAAYEPRWLTIIYTPPQSSSSIQSSGQMYKQLHIVAFTDDVFEMWLDTLTSLCEHRRELMSGMGRAEERELLWDRGIWRGADVGSIDGNDNVRNERLSFGEVEIMCARLGVRMGKADLKGLFKSADVDQSGYLDWTSFRRFVKMLKSRPDIGRLYKRLTLETNDQLTYPIWEKFMLDIQKTTESNEELKRIWKKYTSDSRPKDEVEGLLKEEKTDQRPPSAPSPAPEAMDAMSLCEFTKFLLSSDNAVQGDLARSPLSVYSSSRNPSSRVTISPSVQSVPPAPETGAKVPISDAKPDAEREPTALNVLLHTVRSTQDMTRPLSEYFISSSHNTYLIGHQLVGEATVEGYIRALLGGCRSVELDIYDSEGGPVVTHGKTLTSSVPLSSVCESIMKYAFIASPYPVIISAEVHCSLEGQERLVKILVESFGDALVRAEMRDGEFVVIGFEGRDKACNAYMDGGIVEVETLPSPEELKGKILLKAKNLYVSAKSEMKPKAITVDAESSLTTTTTQSESDRESSGEAFKELKSDLKVEFSRAKSMLKKGLGRSRSRSRAGEARVEENGSEASQLKEVSKEKEKVRMSFSLLALLVYTVGVKCRGLNKKETYSPQHVFSLSERTANRVLKQSIWDLIKHNRNHVVRVYPDGMRIGSTNYEPGKYWAAGCQMVAINWQTFDLGYMINYAMFQRNGRTGYVLKPVGLRLAEKAQLMKVRKYHLSVTVISGQQLPTPDFSPPKDKETVLKERIIDPYVEVSLYLPDFKALLAALQSNELPTSPPKGLTRSNSNSFNSTTSSKTRVVKNNGFNPVWEEIIDLPFECIGQGDIGREMLDLVFLRVEVKDERGGWVLGDRESDDGSLGVWCSSLGCLKEGYRHLPLHDSQLSQYLFSTLFVKIDLEEIILRNS